MHKTLLTVRKKPAELGVEAKDDYTFVVHATNPVPYAVSLNDSPILIAITTKSGRKIGWCMGEKRKLRG